MLFSEQFDFSLESNFKDRLWQKMEQRMEHAASGRDEVSLDSISPPKKTHRQPDGASSTPTMSGSTLGDTPRGVSKKKN
ncbi:MAG: hypothetical protein FWH17_02440 [Oscillospiraceae bacterium]|nr:hypothetical protein [Oscillospiraceae bacterium]